MADKILNRRTAASGLNLRVSQNNNYFDNAAVQLFKMLEKENKEVKDFLIKKYKNTSVLPKTEEKAYNYFLANSVIITAMTANPGGSVFTEFLYTGLSSPLFIDEYVLQCKAGKAVKSRLIAIEKELFKIIEKYRVKNNNVLIGNLGSGPGRDVIDVLSDHYQDSLDIKAIHFDKDISALKRGKVMARIRKVDPLIEFVHENFLKCNSLQKFDILLLIGVLCPLNPTTCINILKTIKNFLKKGGYLIVSNTAKKMEKEDSFAYFIMKWMANWKLVFKDEEDLRQIFEKAGYIWKGGFRDSYGFHLMGIGESL